MSKTSSKLSISRLVKICALKGLKHVVISPGSRNAPLTISFVENKNFHCINIPDERVAAFFALGIALRTKKPVILCCTSGTALLNYAPAIAEAYYQKIPLLVLSADRPVEWIDQRAGQTMRQKDVYHNYIKKSFELIEEANQPEHLWFNDRICNEAINNCTTGGFGPVHLNIPLREPLYNCIETTLVENPKIIDHTAPVIQLDTAQIEDLKKEWLQYKRVLIIIGQGPPSAKFNEVIAKVAKHPNVIVLTETTSNVHADQVFSSIDRLIDGITVDQYAEFSPDLIISCRGSIVSKKIRFMLRKMDIKAHWHVDPNDGYMDTYQALTRLISVDPDYLFSLLPDFPSLEPSDFKKNWSDREMLTRDAHADFIETCPWSDLKVISEILKTIPAGILHLSSSTPIRYSQLFDTRTDILYQCNRGVSGIDGCTSTAAGDAFVANDQVTLITGDIAFFYDSNALWHQHITSNFRIILINNGGGSIFRYIKGPDTTNQLEEHFEAGHTTSAEGIASSFGVLYKAASNEIELEAGLDWIYNSVKDSAAILEICTPREINIPILKDYFQSLSNYTE